jgi:uncharacterized protein involved in exopolysaccharide biosynthesis
MSRIDDALTRVTGKPAETPKSSLFKRFLPESRDGRRTPVRTDERHMPSVSAAARQAIDEQRALANKHHKPRADAETDPTDKVFGPRQLAHYAGFACRAIWRRKVLVVVTFVLTFALIVAAAKYAPPTYEIEVKLLTQKSDIIASLSNPGRTIPYDVNAPTKAAAETVLRRDNVIGLIRETNLLEAWDQTRAPILRLYDRLAAKIKGREPTLDEKLDRLVAEIEDRMSVATDEKANDVVTIWLRWPDGASGYQLVERAQKAFLDARQLEETQQITEAIALLEKYRQNLTRDLTVTLAELTRTQALVLSQLPAPPRLPSTPRSLVAQALDSPNSLLMPSAFEDEALVDPALRADPRLRGLKTSIAAKRNELARLENDQKGKLGQLQAELAAARMIYTANHPTVQSLQQNVAAFQHTSPQILTLRQELDRMETQADEFSALAAERFIRSEMSKRGIAPRPAPVAPVTQAAAVPAPVALADTDLPGMPRRIAVAEFATLRLRMELNQLQGILERTDAARIELAVSQKAFKHRYSVVSPASEPGRPTFPNKRAVVLAGFVIAMLFALFVAIAADVLSHRILEPWQVQRQLGLPLLGKVRLS